MSFLRRESIGKLKNPENIEILNIFDVIKLDQINITEEEYIKLKNGQTIKYKYLGNDEKLHIFKNKKYIGIGDVLFKKQDIISIRRTKFFE